VRLTNARRAIASIVMRSNGSSARASRAASRISDSVSLREDWVGPAIATAYAAAITRQPFCPPNPNEFESASFTPGASRAPSTR
jgi:hypothetical protein